MTEQSTPVEDCWSDWFQGLASEIRQAATPVDELAFVEIEIFDDSSHSGPGWYYWDREYSDEGSCGPFDTREAALEHARAAGYGEVGP